MREVTVRTGSRLHFGLFDLDPTSPSQFGGIGMMIDSPGVTVQASLGAENEHSSQVFAEPHVAERVRKFLGRLVEAYPQVPAMRIEVPEFIPPHHGLGSGTQLAVAVGTAATRLASLDLSAAEIAAATGRGQRSAIGVHGFEHGGFIIDGGHSSNQSLGTLQRRLTIPTDWRVVLVAPNDAAGLSGHDEVQAFQDLPRMAATTSKTLMQTAQQQIVPAIQTADFASFSAGLHEFGQVVGRFFAPVQGGIYRSPIATELASELRNHGLAVVQSSWGPTVAVFASCEAHAQQLASQLQERAVITIVRPLNEAAQITTASRTP